jgi:hypothetical protein
MTYPYSGREELEDIPLSSNDLWFIVGVFIAGSSETISPLYPSATSLTIPSVLF